MARLAQLLVACGCCASVLAIAVRAATAPRTALPTAIDVPGSAGTRAYGINNAGDVVGTYVGSSPGAITSHGFLSTRGRFTTIEYAGSLGTGA